MIKAYTDIEQSRKLTEILPLDSADCYWSYDNIQGFHRIEWFEDGYNKLSQLGEKGIPCWSLAALFKVIPVVLDHANKKYRLRMDESEIDFDIWYEEMDMGLAQLDFDVIAPNMVDACVEMIVKLHSKELL